MPEPDQLLAVPYPGPRPVPGYSVIVPARDEAAVIPALLRAIGVDRPEPHRQVLVLCNGCTDDTAALARRLGPGLDVLERAEPGKAGAIAAGLAAARHETVIVVDADVTISGAALDALALALADAEVWAVSPAVTFDLAGCDWWVRRYYRVFARHPYLQSGVGGAGVYGLSAEGRAAVGSFPPVRSDDGLVRGLIPPARQRRVAWDETGRGVASQVRPPRHLAQLLRAEARWRRGDGELAALGLATPRFPRFLGTALRRREITLADVAVYALVKLAGRLLAAWPGRSDAWRPERD